MRKMVLMLVLPLTFLGCRPSSGQSAAEAAGGQNLEGWLTGQGYTGVPMVRLPTGHFSVAGMVDDVELDMIIDTGASHSVIDVARAERFGLATEDRGGRATGVGMPSQSVESGRLENVRIGPLRFETINVSVLDLSEVNRILSRMGNDPIDGILGADVLMARRAVIDYGSLTLYFR